MNTRLSVCVCAFNGAPVIGRAIDSILAQTYGDFELIVVDDASTDETLRIASGYGDDRVHVVRNRRNLGNARNRSYAIQLTKSELIKFVDQDDWLEPTCLEEHVRLMMETSTVGLTFSRCAIALEDPASSDAEAWWRWSRHARYSLSALPEVDAAELLLGRLVAAGLRENWIGGPTAVMLRRPYLQKSRLFNRRLRQQLDLDLWLRVMAFSDVGYLDRPLASIGIGRHNESRMISATRRDWLDRLWMLEGLMEFPVLWRRYPKLAEMRRTEQKSMVASLLTGRYRTTRFSEALKDMQGYAAYSLHARAGPSSLFDHL